MANVQISARELYLLVFNFDFFNTSFYRAPRWAPMKRNCNLVGREYEFTIVTRLRFSLGGSPGKEIKGFEFWAN